MNKSYPSNPELPNAIGIEAEGIWEPEVDPTADIDEIAVYASVANQLRSGAAIVLPEVEFRLFIDNVVTSAQSGIMFGDSNEVVIQELQGSPVVAEQSEGGTANCILNMSTDVARRLRYELVHTVEHVGRVDLLDADEQPINQLMIREHQDILTEVELANLVALQLARSSHCHLLRNEFKQFQIFIARSYNANKMNKILQATMQRCLWSDTPVSLSGDEMK